MLRMRLEPTARMTPDHAKSYTTSVDLLIQRVVGLSQQAAMTDDLIGDGGCFFFSVDDACSLYLTFL
jgi:hypothetical protein